MKLVLTLAALEDLRSIRAYTLETWGPDQEQRYLDQIWARFEDLSLHPDRYPQTSRNGSHIPFLVPRPRQIPRCDRQPSHCHSLEA